MRTCASKLILALTLTLIERMLLSSTMARTMRRGNELDAALRDGARRQRLLLGANLVDHLCDWRTP